jgi:hypothetical protein
MGRHKSMLSNLQCTECLNVTIIPRPKGRKRKNNHAKHMWCYRCKKTTEHRERRHDYDIIKDDGQVDGDQINGGGII